MPPAKAGLFDSTRVLRLPEVLGGGADPVFAGQLRRRHPNSLVLETRIATICDSADGDLRIELPPSPKPCEKSPASVAYQDAKSSPWPCLGDRQGEVGNPHLRAVLKRCWDHARPSDSDEYRPNRATLESGSPPNRFPVRLPPPWHSNCCSSPSLLNRVANTVELSQSSRRALSATRRSAQGNKSLIITTLWGTRRGC